MSNATAGNTCSDGSRFREGDGASADVVAGGRREEGRYHHERRLLALTLAAVIAASWCPFGPHFAPLMAWGKNNRWADAFSLLNTQLLGPSSLALIVLGVESVFAGSSRRANAAPPDRPRMAIRPFLLVWMAMGTLVACAAPIFASWGFALILYLGPRG